MAKIVLIVTSVFSLNGFSLYQRTSHSHSSSNANDNCCEVFDNNSLYWDNFSNLFHFVIISSLISLALLFLYLFINKSRLTEDKNAAYECGFFPFEWATTSFDIQFFRTSLMFLLFDVEILILFP